MKISAKEFQTDNLKDSQWVGIVEDNQDPLFEGRCRIRVLGKLDGRVDPTDDTSAYIIPTESLPWARPANKFTGGSDSGGGSFDVPKLNSTVNVTFDNGNIYSPVYHYNLYHSDDVQAEIESSYNNAHVLVYDTAFGLTVDDSGTATNARDGEAIKVFFTEAKGFRIDYATTQGSTTVNVKPDNSVEIINANGDSIVMLNDGNITFTHSAKFIINSSDNTEINCKDAIINCDNMVVNQSSSIELGKGATEKIVLGDSFMEFFNQHTHIANLGAPTSPPIAPFTPALLSKKNVKSL